MFGESIKLERTEVNGLIVSTVITSDMGPETAIIDSVGVHPVQRYDTKEEALKGHKDWVVKCFNGLSKVLKLGYLGLVKDKEITLERIEND